MIHLLAELTWRCVRPPPDAPARDQSPSDPPAAPPPGRRAGDRAPPASATWGPAATPDPGQDALVTLFTALARRQVDERYGKCRCSW